MPTKVRIDSKYVPDEAQLVDTLLSLTKAPQNALIVEEITPKQHYHIYLEDTPSLPTVRTRIKEVLQIPDSKKHNAYSVNDKHNNWPGYRAYLVKQEDTRIVYNQTYDISELKSYYGEVSSKNIEGKKTHIEEFEKYIENKKWETPLDLATLVRKWYWSRKKTFHKADMARIVQTIWYGNREYTCVFDEQIVQEADIGYLSRPGFVPDKIWQ